MSESNEESNDRRAIIDTKTLIPIGVIGAIIVVVVAATTLSNTVSTQGEAIGYLKLAVAALQSDRNTLSERMVRIEEKLDTLIKQSK